MTFLEEGDILMDRKEAAAYLNLKNPRTLNVWDSTKRYDLQPIKVGRKSVRYKRSRLTWFLESGLIKG